MTVGDQAPYVSVFVLNYNGLEVLPACLEALRRTNYPQDRWQAVVLDNGSRDGSAERAERAHPWLEVRRLGRNLGFAAGNNAGLRSAPGPYAALLNSDTEVEPGWLTALVQDAEAHPEAGACTAKLLFRHRRLPVQLQTAGFVPAHAGAGDTRLLGLQVQDVTSLVGGQRVAAHWGTGCFAPETGPYGPFRWTSSAGTLEVAAEPGEQTELYLRLAAPRPDDATVPFSVTVGGETVARSSAGAIFSDYHVSLPGTLTTAARPIIQNAGTPAAGERRRARPGHRVTPRPAGLRAGRGAIRRAGGGVRLLRGSLPAAEERPGGSGLLRSELLSLLRGPRSELAATAARPDGPLRAAVGCLARPRGHKRRMGHRSLPTTWTATAR